MIIKSSVGLAALAAIALTFALLVPGTVPSTAAGETPLERYCTECHGLERVHAQKIPAAKWWMTIRRMSTYDGFELTSAQQKEVFQYLRENLAIDGPGGRQRELDSQSGKK